MFFQLVFIHKKNFQLNIKKIMIIFLFNQMIIKLSRVKLHDREKKIESQKRIFKHL
jgi:hypothetical protein